MIYKIEQIFDEEIYDKVQSRNALEIIEALSNYGKELILYYYNMSTSATVLQLAISNEDLLV